MLNKSPTILAVDPGSRELGVAVLQNGELLFCGVKTVGNRRTPLMILEAVSSHIRNLIEKYRPAHLAIEEITFSQQNSALLAVIAEQVKNIATGHRMLISEYATTTVRKRLCRTGRATRRETATALAERFPELKRYLRATKWECDYYGSLFDAVALAVTCEEGLIESELLKRDETKS